MEDQIDGLQIAVISGDVQRCPATLVKTYRKMKEEKKEEKDRSALARPAQIDRGRKKNRWGK